MTSPDILVICPLLPALMEALENTYTVHQYWLYENQEAFPNERGSQIRAIVTSFAHGVDATLLTKLPHLEVIASYGVGVDQIPLDLIKQRGIVLTNTPDISEPVADTAMALLLAATRRICEADRFVKAGEWTDASFPFGVGLQGKTCGIVGLGRIGKAVARRAEAFGLKVAYYGPRQKSEVSYPYYGDLTALAKVSDFLVLALPGGLTTQRIVDERILTALGPNGFLINVARGSVVDEAALIHSLKTRQIAGAGLDVFEMEPLTESPLLALDNVVLLPHIASATHETRHEMGEVVLANLKAHFEGRPVLNPVTQ